MNTIQLTQKLISIPSYVGQDCNEVKIANYIFEYLKTSLPWMNVTKQYVKNNRYNILATDNSPTSLILCGHIDTVQPRQGWDTDPFSPTIKEGKLYGLGATDMKASVASLICALQEFRQTKGVMLLLYIDEEYDFLGMKQFVKEYKGKLTPDLVVSADGNGLSIGNGCRGVIELKATIKGKTGHAANPNIGVNAIQKANAIVQLLTTELSKSYSSSILGISSCNLAYMQGGLDIGKENDIQMFGKEGNNIADICEFILDIRPATKKLTANIIKRMFFKFCKQEGVDLVNISVRHNIRPWITPLSQISKQLSVIKQTMPLSFTDMNTSGYIDTQMIWEAFDDVPCITFGPGENGMPHKPNEYVRISSLTKVQTVYENLISRFGKGVK